MTDALVTMDLHPLPAAGLAKPWEFPVPERGALANGLTVLRCHRPGQQVVAVEICLDAPLDAEPDGLDGIATIMVHALSEGMRPVHSRGVRRRAGALRRDARLAGRLHRRPALAGGARLPPGRGRSACSPRRCARPTFAGSEVERLVRNRLDEIPHELANPAAARGQAALGGAVPGVVADVPAAPGHRGDRRPDRRRRRARVLRGARAAGHRDRVVVGDLVRASTWTRMLAGTLGGWTGDTAAPVTAPPVTADDAGRVVIVDRPGAVQTQLLIGRTGPDRHDPIWPALVVGTYCLGGTLTSRLDRVLREEKGYTYGVRAFAQVLRSPAQRLATARRALAAGHQRRGRHSVHRPRPGRPAGRAADAGGRRADRRRA